MKTIPTKYRNVYIHTGTLYTYKVKPVSEWRNWNQGNSVVALSFSRCKAALRLGKLDALLSVLPHIWSAAKLYFCRFLAVRFTLAYIWGCGYPDKPNWPKSTHLIHNSRCKSTQGVLGEWLGLQKYHQHEIPKEIFHHVLWKDMFVFPQLQLTDVFSPLLNY